MSGRTGLDYAAIRPTCDLLGIDVDNGLFMDLRAMETEALKVWAKK